MPPSDPGQIATVLVAFAVVDGRPSPDERRKRHQRSAAGDRIDRACGKRSAEGQRVGAKRRPRRVRCGRHRCARRAIALRLLEPAPAHRLEHGDRERRRREVHRDDDGEHRNPRAGRLVEQRGHRTAEHRADALRHVETSVVGGRVLASRRCRSASTGTARRSRPIRRTPRPTAARTAPGCAASAATASSPCLRGAKAISIVFSRPMRSEIQPKNGRVAPFVMRSSDSASGSTGSPNTSTPAMPKSRVNAPICDVTISPVVDIIVIMANISQKIGVREHLGRRDVDRGVLVAGAGRAPALIPGHLPGRVRAPQALAPRPGRRRRRPGRSA